MKNLYIKTFGCQMNEYDTKRIAHLLSPLGYKMNDDIESADLIILNTCSIRQKAEHKVYSMLGRLKPYKKKNSSLIIAVGGCVAQQEGKKLLGRNMHLDLVFGTKSVQALPEVIQKIEQSGGRYVRINGGAAADSSIGNAIDYYKRNPKACLTIIEGCNNFCSYCIVPYVRGQERCRPVQNIIEEVKALAKEGVKEITLLGQNVNSYYDAGNGGANFPLLLNKVASIDGIERLRFVTSHPKDLTDELIRCFGEIDKLCNHIHLPVQSGSDSVLERMNRGYTVEDYLSKVDKLRKVCHNISVTTDIIVGFPGESEADFNNTLDLINKIKCDNSFSFVYSKRTGTKAAEFDDDLGSEEKKARLSKLQTLQKEITRSKNKEFEGQILDVLVEGASKKDPDRLTGRTNCNRVVNFSGDLALTGKVVKVNVTKGYTNSLKGELVRS